MPNRIEVIDHTSNAEKFGRAFVKRGEVEFTVTVEEQDDGKTVKIFIDDARDATEVPN